jgi:HEPN domain-containing protein
MNQIKIINSTCAVELQEIINRIIQLIMVESIYSINTKHHDIEYNDLIILVSNKSTKVLTELAPILNTVICTYPNYRYRLFYAHQVKESIKRGNLFLYDACSSDRLVYTNPITNFNVHPDSLNISSVLEKAKIGFESEMNKIQPFSDGADFYIEKGNYEHAAFMLHQHIELSFRAIERFAMGKDKVTHSIRVHQKNVAPYLQDMGLLFNEDNEVEQKLMQQLDDAYLAVRYEDNYQISEDSILLAKKKCIIAKEMADKHYSNMIEEFGIKHLHKISLQQRELTITKNEKNLKLEGIIPQMSTYTDIQRVYCFGSRTYSVARMEALNNNEIKEEIYTHYDLLVIANDDQPLYNYQGNFNNDESGDSLFLLVHDEQYFNQSFENQDLFIQKIIKGADLIYLKEGQQAINISNEPTEKKDIDQKHLDSAKREWFDRYWNARGFIDGAAEIQDCECMPVKVYMLNQGMEQLCTGLIKAYFDYKPKRHTITHLFDLCCSFLSFPEDIFPRKTTDDKELFNIMADAINLLRYKGTFSISMEEMNIMEKRCAIFMEKADQYAREKLLCPLI